jgi:ligand-binding sensor domain-containing protein
MKRELLSGLLQLALGIATVALAAYLAAAWLASERAANIPAGRQIIRPPHDVACLAVVDGAVWAGGKEGLFQFAADGRPLVVPVPLQGLRFVAALLPEADGSVWVAHEDGVSRWRAGTLRHYSTLAGAFPGRGLALLRDRAGTLWAGSDRSLTRLVADAFVRVPLPDAFGLTEAAVLFEDDSGRLWIGDSSPRSPGLVRRDATGFHLLTRRDGLPHHAINAIMQVQGGSSLWIGTGFAGEGGAVFVDNNAWRAVGTAQGLAGNKVRSIFEDSAGRFWFGSEYDGVAVFGAQRLAVIAEADGLAGPEVKAILEYPTGIYWLGTNGGLTRLSDFDSTRGDPRYPGFAERRP